MSYKKLVICFTNILCGFYSSIFPYTFLITILISFQYKVLSLLCNLLPFFLGFIFYKYFLPIGFYFAIITGSIVHMGNNLIIVQEKPKLLGGLPKQFKLRNTIKSTQSLQFKNLKLGDEVKCACILNRSLNGSIKKIYYHRSGNISLIARIRQYIIIKFNNSKFSAFLKSIIIGDRSFLSTEEIKMFKNIGIYHLLSISGLHMNILMLTCILFFRKLMALSFTLSYKFNTHFISSVIAIIIGLGYFSISLGSIPTLRAFLMTSITLISARRINKLKLLCICALSFVCINPRIILDYSFQLSFLATSAVLIGRNTISVNYFLLPLLPQFNIISIVVNLIAINLFPYILCISIFYLIIQNIYIIKLVDLLIMILYQVASIQIPTINMIINFPLKIIYFLAILHDIIHQKIELSKYIFILVIFINLIMFIFVRLI